MLHVPFAHRQARLRRAIVVAALAFGALLAGAGPAHAARSDDLARAQQLAAEGQHVDAATLYEKLAKRGLRAQDPRLTLLAAREYVAAGSFDSADRVLAKLPANLDDDDRLLLMRTRAELELARGDAESAVDALRNLPVSLPPALAAELLQLRAQAEFESGQVLAGTRSLIERGRVLTTPEDREANARALVDAIAKRPIALDAIPVDASDEERGWLELGSIRAREVTDPAGATALARDWRTRYPLHPGTLLMPGTTSSAVVTMPSGPLTKVALVLPLSGRQQGFGEVVRDGFLAAALADPADVRPTVSVYDTAAAGVDAAYRKALDEGAQFVVGPLLREDVARLAGSAQVTVPTLALNALPDGAPPPLYQFSLDPEQEARAVAQRIALDGYLRGIALFPRSAWGQRMQDAFTSEAVNSGLTLTAVQQYDPGTQDFSGPLRLALGRFGGAGDEDDKPGATPRKRDSAAEAREGPQFVFIAAPGAKLARTMVPQLRFQMVYRPAIYANSDAWDPSVRAASDLDGMTFPEMPWILYGGQGAPELWTALQGNAWTGAAHNRMRLYAFGYDAFRLMSEFRGASMVLGVDGLTGSLNVGNDGHVTREFDWARIESGRLQPAHSGPPLPSPRDVPTGQ